MNTIFDKLKPKRKYHKTPTCGHTEGYCDMEHCREKYAIKLNPKKHSQQKIDEYLHHREKVIKRRREIELAKLDVINIDVDGYVGLGGKDACNPSQRLYIQGEYGKHKQELKKYKRMLVKGILTLNVCQVWRESKTISKVAKNKVGK